jgi:hypothetical protein
VDVEQPAAEGARDLARHELEVAGEHHQLRVVSREQLADGAGVRRVERLGGDATRRGAREGARVGAVRGDHHHVARAPLAQRAEVIEEGAEVGAAARREHRDPGARHGRAARKRATAAPSVVARLASSLARNASAAGVSGPATSTPTPPNASAGDTSRQRSPTKRERAGSRPSSAAARSYRQRSGLPARARPVHGWVMRAVVGGVEPRALRREQLGGARRHALVVGGGDQPARDPALVRNHYVTTPAALSARTAGGGPGEDHHTAGITQVVAVLDQRAVAVEEGGAHARGRRCGHG